MARFASASPIRPRSTRSSTLRRTSRSWPTSDPPVSRPHRRRPGGDAEDDRRRVDRRALPRHPGGRSFRPPARPRAAALRAGADGAPLRARGAERRLHEGAVVPRRRHLRPLRAGGRRHRDAARRVLDGLYAVPAGDEPGRAAGDLRVPDRDLRAHGHGRLERVGLRRDDRHGGRLLHREARDRPDEDRHHRGDESASTPGREDIRARLRPRDRRGAARRRDDRSRSRASRRRRCSRRDLPAAERLRLPRAGAGARRRGERRRGAGDRSRRPAVTRRPRGTRAGTAARSRSARARLPGTSRPTAGRTTAFSRAVRTSSGECQDGSSARR